MRYGLPKISQAAAIDRAQLAMRAHLCSHCPYRSREELTGIDTPRGCERWCEFFRRLPRLVQVARCVDPMVGSLNGMLNEQIHEVYKTLPRYAEGRRNFLLMERPQIISDLEKIVGH